MPFVHEKRFVIPWEISQRRRNEKVLLTMLTTLKEAFDFKIDAAFTTVDRKVLQTPYDVLHYALIGEDTLDQKDNVLVRHSTLIEVYNLADLKAYAKYWDQDAKGFDSCDICEYRRRGVGEIDVPGDFFCERGFKPMRITDCGEAYQPKIPNAEGRSARPLKELIRSVLTER